ncbi:MAG: hypothetical protein ACREF4_04365, partial [Gammaproteobacteria bacterium]
MNLLFMALSFRHAWRWTIIRTFGMRGLRKRSATAGWRKRPDDRRRKTGISTVRAKEAAQG